MGGLSRYTRAGREKNMRVLKAVSVKQAYAKHQMKYARKTSSVFIVGETCEKVENAVIINILDKIKRLLEKSDVNISKIKVEWAINNLKVWRLGIFKQSGNWVFTMSLKEKKEVLRDVEE